MIRFNDKIKPWVLSNSLYSDRDESTTDTDIIVSWCWHDELCGLRFNRERWVPILIYLTSLT